MPLHSCEERSRVKGMTYLTLASFLQLGLPVCSLMTLISNYKGATLLKSPATLPLFFWIRQSKGDGGGTGDSLVSKNRDDSGCLPSHPLLDQLLHDTLSP